MLAIQDVILMIGWAAFAMLRVVLLMQEQKAGSAVLNQDNRP